VSPSHRTGMLESSGADSTEIKKMDSPVAYGAQTKTASDRLMLLLEKLETVDSRTGVSKSLFKEG
jgi:hypothetical protein